LALTIGRALPNRHQLLVERGGLVRWLIGEVRAVKLYEWELLGNYGSGWDLLTTADSRSEILQLEKDYRLNEPTTPLKIKSVRVREKANK
jgi:hypothetical protein